MPLIVPDDLATRWVLEADGVYLIDRAGAARQECRPLRLLVVDLEGGGAPEAVDDLLLLASQSPLQIEPVLATLPGMTPSRSRIQASVPWDARWQDRFDAVILADRPSDGGLPQHSPWWDEFRDLLDWAGDHARAHLLVGWSAAAALAHRHGVECVDGVERIDRRVQHRVLRRQSYLLRGVDDHFTVPVRWHRRPPQRFLLDVPGLDLLAESTSGDPYLLRTHDRRTVYLLHHPIGGIDPRTGSSHTALLLANWIHYYLYQPTSLPMPSLNAATAQR